MAEISVEPKIEEGWKAVLNNEFQSDYFLELKRFLLEEKRKGNMIYPKGENIFAAFNLTPFKDVKVIILGQDPYHGPGQAHGLSFSVKEGVLHPPSLRNIFTEIFNDTGVKRPVSGDLTNWAKQGVFLLNAILTVRANQPASHQNRGWERFTDAVIRAISDHSSGVVFMLWGKFAQSKESLIDRSKHLVLKAPHPSPLSASSGFFGCRHFSKANKYLESVGKAPINWSL